MIPEQHSLLERKEVQVIRGKQVNRNPPTSIGPVDTLVKQDL
jgi:hypothetical protein